MSSIRRRLLSVVICLGLIGLYAVFTWPVDATDLLFSVAPTVETAPVPHSGDAADDSAIWIHPTETYSSTIIGTDKLGGLAVYDLAGRQLQYLPDGDMNNVDLRYNFPLGNQRIALVTAGNRSNNSIAIYRVEPTTRGLENIAARTITPSISVYGSCMYHSAATGKYYLFINDKNGAVQQWELFSIGAGLVDAVQVRSFAVGSQTEGCVADDELGWFYIGEEAVAIWKYGAEPGTGAARTLVDATGATGHLTSNIEGLSIYYASNGTGYLLASSQGSDTYVIYQREANNAYVATFNIGAGNGIDGTSGTDGIDVTNFGLGHAFSQGVFVAQDTTNDNGNQNFKLVPWQSIANGIIPALSANTLYRVGLHQRKGSGANGLLEAFIATGDSAFGTPFGSSAGESFTTQATKFQFGATNSNAVNAMFDDIKLDSVAMPGPSGGSTSPTATPTPPNTPTATPTPATPTPAVANLLLNGGFELDANGNGQPDNWTSSSSFTRSTSLVRSGKYAGKHFASNNASYTISQQVANLHAGQSYRFSGAVNIPSTSDNFTFKLDVQWRNSSGSTLRTDTLKTYSKSSSGAWDQVSVLLSLAPTGTSSAQIRMVVSSLNATVYVDDFVFQ